MSYLGLDGGLHTCVQLLVEVELVVIVARLAVVMSSMIAGWVSC